MNLNLLFFIPLLSIGGIMLGKPTMAKWIAMIAALLQLGLTVALLYNFLQLPHAGLTGTPVFQTSYSWFEPLGIWWHTGIDGIALAMLLLTAVVLFAGILLSWNQTHMPKTFFILITLLGMGAYGFFISLDLFALFFFLELAVVPKFLLIGIWGSGKKEYSATKLALMLMGASALVFVGLLGLYIYQPNSHFNMLSLAQHPLELAQQLFFFPFAFVGFGIFTALFPFHTWVPDGHSSAPTAASMFLAGISMKLGGYGCLRVAVFLMPDAAQYYAPWIIVLAAAAIIYGAFATMMQTDLKYMNAYSSISHCGFVLLGIGVLTQTGIAGAVIQMVSHGLMTALFFAVIGMVYERTHTRQVNELGGLLQAVPFISTLFVLAGLCSLGLPGLSGFVAEMTVFVGAWERPEMIYRIATVAAAASIVVTAVYILNAAGKVIMGPLKNAHFALLKDATWYEKTAAIVLMAGILMIGIAPFLITNLIGAGTAAIYRQVAGLPQ
jgi:NADH-quinone oxidoreductase subunit M